MTSEAVHPDTPSASDWGLGNWFPPAGWLRTCTGGSLIADPIGGVTPAAYLLPAALSVASLAGLPPQAGMCTCLMGGLIFWLFSSSTRTSITVTTAIALLVGTSLGDLVHGDPARFWAPASCTSLLIGAPALIIWAIRAGVVINFVSETMLLGFKCSIAFVLAGKQLPTLFGLSAGHGNLWENTRHFLRHLNQASLPSPSRSASTGCCGRRRRSTRCRASPPRRSLRPDAARCLSACARYARFGGRTPGRPRTEGSYRKDVTRPLYARQQRRAHFPAHRTVTSELNGGGPNLRLKQEPILGIGGWLLLRSLGLRPEVCHLIEGHAASAVPARAHSLVQEDSVPFGWRRQPRARAFCSRRTWRSNPELTASRRT